jgi:hypothetical protein
MHTHPLEPRIAHLEGAFDQINERLGNIDRRLEGVDQRFNWVIGTIVATWITTILTIIFHR